MYIYRYCVYPAISKGPKQLPNCLKLAETSIALNVFKGVICDVSPYTVTVSLFCSTGIRYQKSFISVSDRIYNKNLSSQCNLTAQIEPVKDNSLYNVYHILFAPCGPLIGNKKIIHILDHLICYTTNHFVFSLVLIHRIHFPCLCFVERRTTVDLLFICRKNSYSCLFWHSFNFELCFVVSMPKPDFVFYTYVGLLYTLLYILLIHCIQDLPGVSNLGVYML